MTQQRLRFVTWATLCSCKVSERVSGVQTRALSTGVRPKSTVVSVMDSRLTSTLSAVSPMNWPQEATLPSPMLKISVAQSSPGPLYPVYLPNGPINSPIWCTNALIKTPRGALALSKWRRMPSYEALNSAERRGNWSIKGSTTCREVGALVMG